MVYIKENIPQIKDILIANNFDKDFTNELPADSYVAPPIIWMFKKKMFLVFHIHRLISIIWMFKKK